MRRYVSEYFTRIAHKKAEQAGLAKRNLALP